MADWYIWYKIDEWQYCQSIIDGIGQLKSGVGVEQDKLVCHV